MSLRPLIIALALVGAASLAGCGKTGELERPAPLFGGQAKADYDAQKAADAAAKARDAAARRSQRGNTVFDPVDQPATQAPYAPSIPGRTDPLGPSAQTPGAGASYSPDR
jgi:predicted small lipoprotein YifL